jgi:integrase/recombinase XerD
MNALLDQPAQFASLVEQFFVDRLMSQKNASPRTIESYRDTFRMIFRYAEKQLHKPPAQLTPPAAGQTPPPVCGSNSSTP